MTSNEPQKRPWWPPSAETIELISVYVRMAACLGLGGWGLVHEATAVSSDPQLIPVFAAIFAYPFWKWGDSKK